MDDFQKFSGYFIGQFMEEKGFPILATDEVEIAYKKLPEKFEKEFLVVYPQATLKNISTQKGTELIVVKAPSVPGDKLQ